MIVYYTAAVCCCESSTAAEETTAFSLPVTPPLLVFEAVWIAVLVAPPSRPRDLDLLINQDKYLSKETMHFKIINKILFLKSLYK